MKTLEILPYSPHTIYKKPALYKHKFIFTITPEEITGNLISWAHTKILTYANSDIPNIDGVGTHKGCADLAGATVV